MKKTHMVISTDEEKRLHKIQEVFMKKRLERKE
jgi:hypothetical protein